MKPLALALLFVLALTSVAFAEDCAPWVVYGQTPIDAWSSVLNPTPNASGVLGEVTALPYTVPDGAVLHLEQVAIEAIFGSALIPYVGSGVSTTTALMSFSTGSSGGEYLLSSRVWSGLPFQIPAGRTLGVYLVGGAAEGGWFYGWSLAGRLCAQ